MKYFSLFAGIGGFEIAAEKFNLECAGYSEIDKYAIKVYNKHFPNHKNYGDIKHIQWDTVPNFNFLFAGFPCPEFSIANSKRKGLDSERARIIKNKPAGLYNIRQVRISTDGGQVKEIPE